MKTFTLSVLLLVMMITGSGSVFALDHKKKHRGANSLSMDEAANMIRKRDVGRILRAKRTTHKSGQEMYRFRVLNKKGAVRIFEVNPKNPEIIRGLD